jgi:hypothetical protein
MIVPTDSFGMVVYEVVHQRKPFDDIADITAAVTNMDSIPHVRPPIQAELPEFLKQMMTNCWLTTPGARWNIDQVQLQLQQADVGGLEKALMLQ